MVSFNKAPEMRLTRREHESAGGAGRAGAGGSVADDGGARGGTARGEERFGGGEGGERGEGSEECEARVAHGGRGGGRWRWCWW